MGCVSTPPNVSRSVNMSPNVNVSPNVQQQASPPNVLQIQPITNQHWRQLEYPRARNEVILNPYSLQDWIEVQERASGEWCVVTIIDKECNWIRVLSQSPNLQFTDKLHTLHDVDRIRALGDNNNNNNNDVTEINEINEEDNVSIKYIKKNGIFNKILTDNLYKNGFELINDIKYDSTDNTITTIYKSFSYQLYRNTNTSHNEFSSNISKHINNNANNQYFNKFIPNWLTIKLNDKLLTDQHYLIILSHFSKLNVIVHGFNDNKLDIIYSFMDDDNTNNIFFYYNNQTKQYKLLKNTMKYIRNQIDDQNNNYLLWNNTQILKWLNIIECGLFNDINNSEYNNFKKSMKKLNICGKNLNKINDLTLKSFGLNNEYDIELVISNINELIDKPQTAIVSNDDGSNVGGVVTPTNDDNDTIVIPDEFLDPITLEIMRDPVLSCVSGHTFEKTSIIQWINQKHIDPINQKPLTVNQLIPNRTLRETIDRFIKLYDKQSDENNDIIGSN